MPRSSVDVLACNGWENVARERARRTRPRGGSIVRYSWEEPSLSVPESSLGSVGSLRLGVTNFALTAFSGSEGLLRTAWLRSKAGIAREKRPIVDIVVPRAVEAASTRVLELPEM